jgi:hypothetical protein
MEFDPKKKVIEELMQYLSSKDDDDLKGSMTPDAGGLEVTKVEGMPEEKDGEAPSADGISDGDGDEGSNPDSKMSDEELNELIEAISSKMG